MQIEVGQFVYQIYMATAGSVMPVPDTDPVVSIDTETVPIVPGEPLVPALMQVCNHELRRIDLVPADQIEGYSEALFHMYPGMKVVMHNAPFDLEVLGLRRPGREFLMAAVDEGRVIDTGIRYLLQQLARGRFAGKWALDYVAWDMLHITVLKDEDVRFSFSPGMQLTEEQCMYAAKDAAVTIQLFHKMPEPYPTEDIQLGGFIALSDIGRRGMFVDVLYLKKLREEFTARMMSNINNLAAFGYYPKSAGVQTVLQQMMVHIEKELQFLDNDNTLEFQRTDKKGMIQVTDASLQIMGSRIHPFVEAYRDFKHCEKMIGTYMNPHLVHRDLRVHPRFSPLVKTGRTSCSGPNIQNISRKEGIRGIYWAAPGHVLYAPDYGQLELCALGATCLHFYGESKMAEIINSGVKIHPWFAAQLLGKRIEDVTDTEKQGAKACNFGFPGGLGLRKFQWIAKHQYDVDLSLDDCKARKQAWMAIYPEMKYHLKPPVDFGYKDDETGEPRYIARTITGRIRRNATYCSACNYPFQGLAADGAKLALWYCYKEGYPMVNFVHDEIIFELPEDQYLQDRIRRINYLMVTGMQEVIQTVKIKVEGALMRRWYKEAKPVLAENGDLLVWEPQQ